MVDVKKIVRLDRLHWNVRPMLVILEGRATTSTLQVSPTIDG